MEMIFVESFRRRNCVLDSRRGDPRYKPQRARRCGYNYVSDRVTSLLPGRAAAEERGDLGTFSAFFAICGMWVLAPSFTLLAQEVRAPGGGGFGWEDFGYLLISSFVPTRIFEMVTLEGSIIALLIGTIEMIICHFAFERTRWIVPPSWATLHHPNR